MFGHYPIAEKTIGNILESTNGPQQENRFGVQLNEFSQLLDEEDFFDAGIGDGPNPPIAEVLTCHVPVCEIPLEDDEEILKPRVAKTRIQGESNSGIIRCGQDKSGGLEHALPVNPNTMQCNTMREQRAKGTFTVNQLAYNMCRPGYTMILYGPRRSGKSKLIRNICQRMRHYFPEVIVFTMTKASGEFFSYVPYHRVIEGLDEDLLEKIIEHQQSLKEAETRGEDIGNYHVLVIIDDCMAEGLRYKKIFNKIFYNGRHLGITLIVAVQDVRGVAPSATINADIAFSFSLPDHRGRDTVREKFVDYLTRDEFDNLYDHEMINQKYHVVAFDIAHRYNPLDKRISVGCVDEAAEEPFVLGCRDMWVETAASKKQLQELGFGHLLDQEDWGIVQPKKKKK